MQCILVDLGFKWDFETNYAYGNIHYVEIPSVGGNIHYVEIPSVGRSTRMHCRFL